MNLIICGDTAPTTRDREAFTSGITDNVISTEIMNILKEADYRVFNLETPICSERKEIKKCGPCLYAPPEVMAGIKELKPNLVVLANNHIMDQDVLGLEQTQDLLKENKINWVGAGKNIEEAKQSFIVELEGIKLGFYACAEHEFSIATKDSSGANPFDPLESLDHIASLKNKCDYVVCLYHGGKEYYRYPSPYLQKVCRRIIDKGADLVVCQHSHCIGCKEEYKHGTIVYGQGNFIFAGEDDEFWNSSMMVSVQLDKEDEKIHHDIEYIPIVRQDNRVVMPDEKLKSELLNDFLERSEEIKSEDFVQNSYREFALGWERYLDVCQGKYFRIMQKIIGRMPRMIKGIFSNIIKSRKCYSTANLLALQNFIECEAHRELFVEYLKEQIKDSKN